MTLGRDFMHAYDGINYGLLCMVVVLGFAASMSLVIREKKAQNAKLYFENWSVCLVFTLYVSFMLAGTLLNRLPDPTCVAKVIPFWSYWEMIVNKSENMWKQILYNIFVFIPWGILLPILYTKARKMKVTILSATIFSLVIELIQLIFHLGFFEFDDIFHNTLGALIGYGLWKLVSKYMRKAKLNE